MNGDAGEAASASDDARRRRRRGWWRRAGLLALVLVIAGFFWWRGDLAARLMKADPDAPVLGPSLTSYALSSGASAYRGRCQGCHGEAGRGDSTRGVPDLTDADWLYGSGLASDIEKIVYDGVRAHRPRTWNLADMPRYARLQPTATGIPPLGPGEIGDVITFLSSAAGKPAEAAAAERGRAIYQGQGGCFDCHGGDARGDAAIGAPDLVDGVWLYGDGGRESVFRSIAFGHAGVCPGWLGKPKPAQMRALAIYVQRFSHPKAKKGEAG